MALPDNGIMGAERREDIMICVKTMAESLVFKVKGRACGVYDIIDIVLYLLLLLLLNIIIFKYY